MNKLRSNIKGGDGNMNNAPNSNAMTSSNAMSAENLTKKGMEGVKILEETASKAPLQMKIATIIIFFSLTYIFTLIYFNLPLSIIFAIITFLTISLLLSKMIGMIFLILYIVVVYNKSVEIKNTIGEPVYETDIVSNSDAPYDCLANQLVVTKDKLQQDLIGGYFTYNFWIYINGNNNALNDNDNWYSYRYKEWKNVFYRGTPMRPDADLSGLVQYPGVWLTPVLNNMVIVFQNSTYVERLEINGIPFNSWTNITIVVESKSVSIYINGKLDRTLNLTQNIMIMNGYNLYLTGDVLASQYKQSGFAGRLAELIFYGYALSPVDIYNSYNLYKKIIDNYQKKYYRDNKDEYKIPDLITNSDYLSNNNIKDKIKNRRNRN